MKNLITRTLSGAVYVVLLLATALWYAEAFACFFLVVLVIAGNEFKKIIGADRGIYYWLIPVYLFYVIHVLAPEPIVKYSLHYILLIFPLINSVFMLLKKRDIRKCLEDSATSVVYLSIPLASILQLRTGFNGGLVIPFFIMIWANDTGAYLVGKNFGKRLLASSISPKKTVEGFIGGMCMSIIAGIIASMYVKELSTANAVGMAITVALFSNIGDLVESALKRSAGVKDSGTAFPGHGGFLDRFDSVIFAAPATLVYLKVFYPWL